MKHLKGKIAILEHKITQVEKERDRALAEADDAAQAPLRPQNDAGGPVASSAELQSRLDSKVRKLRRRIERRRRRRNDDAAASSSSQ